MIAKEELEERERSWKSGGGGRMEEIKEIEIERKRKGWERRDNSVTEAVRRKRRWQERDNVTEEIMRRERDGAM